VATIRIVTAPLARHFGLARIDYDHAEAVATMAKPPKAWTVEPAESVTEAVGR